MEHAGEPQIRHHVTYQHALQPRATNRLISLYDAPRPTITAHFQILQRRASVNGTLLYWKPQAFTDGTPSTSHHIIHNFGRWVELKQKYHTIPS